MTMPRPTALLKRSLIFVHRWLGVALSILFTVWFVSGIVMMYWSFPDVTTEDRLARAATLTAAALKFSPADAYASLQRDEPVGQVRLTSFDGRPLYQFGRGGAMVFADDGRERGPADDVLLDRVAAGWAGLPASEASKTSVIEVDQWTVAGRLRNLRPLYKYTFTDGQQVYVDGTSGDVVQYTTTSSRVWAYLGAIPHWMYFTPLRKHQQEWFSFVVYSSLIGTVAALMGVVIAIWMYSPAKRYRYAGVPTSIPYRGWKRWHTIIGLLFGVSTTTWAFSGLLSMGPFPILDRLTELTVPSDRQAQATAPAPAGARGRANRDPNIAEALRGGDGQFHLAAYTAKPPAAAIAELSGFPVKELEFTTFDGEPVYLATNATGDTRVVPVNGPPTDSFDVNRVMEIVRTAAGTGLAELTIKDEYDAYYLDRRRRAPLPVVYARMNDAASTRYYIDPKTARVVGSYNSRNWISRWLYHGLHSLDFPWLYKYRPLWDIVVIALMLGGTAVCVTSLVLTYKVVARTLVGMLKPATPRSSDDLAVES